MHKPVRLDGIGVRIYSEDGVTFMDLLFEVDDVALDGETGEAVPSGMRRILKLNEGQSLRSIAEYEEVARKIAAAGFPAQGILPGKMRPVNWAYYTMKGYDARF